MCIISLYKLLLNFTYMKIYLEVQYEWYYLILIEDIVQHSFIEIWFSSSHNFLLLNAQIAWIL